MKIQLSAHKLTDDGKVAETIETLTLDTEDGRDIYDIINTLEDAVVNKINEEQELEEELDDENDGEAESERRFTRIVIDSYLRKRKRETTD